MGKNSFCAFCCSRKLLFEKDQTLFKYINKNDIKMLYECLTLVEGKTGKPVKQ